LQADPAVLVAAVAVMMQPVALPLRVKVIQAEQALEAVTAAVAVEPGGLVLQVSMALVPEMAELVLLVQ
jgi:hypothetical protein